MKGSIGATDRNKYFRQYPEDVGKWDNTEVLGGGRGEWNFLDEHMNLEEREHWTNCLTPCLEVGAKLYS